MISHVLRITVDPDNPDDRCAEVICPGVTDACRTWWECTTEDHEYDHRKYADLGEAILDGHTSYHGVEHRYIDNMLMTPSAQCFGQALDGAVEAAHDEAAGRAPGDYPCDVVYEGDGGVYIAVTSPRP